MKKLSLKVRLSLFALLSMFASASFALPPDFSTLTGAVDFSTAITAILAVMAGLAGVYIVVKGGQLILARIRG